MLEMNELLQKAVDANVGLPLKLVDPRTKEVDVLLTTGLLDQLLESIPESDELDGIDVGKLIDRAIREDDANDPTLESYKLLQDTP